MPRLKLLLPVSHLCHLCLTVADVFIVLFLLTTLHALKGCIKLHLYLNTDRENIDNTISTNADKLVPTEEHKQFISLSLCTWYTTTLTRKIFTAENIAYHIQNVKFICVKFHFKSKTDTLNVLTEI